MDAFGSVEGGTLWPLATGFGASVLGDGSTCPEGKVRAAAVQAEGKKANTARAVHRFICRKRRRGTGVEAFAAPG